MTLDRRLTAIGLLCGASFYFLISFSDIILGFDHKTFGTQIYNYYYLSVLEGRLDVPLRIVTVEGHYDPQGHAFVYHGIAPLITRALLYPMVRLTEFPVARLSVWLFATLGTAVLHLILARIVHRFTDARPGQRQRLQLIAGVMAWTISPGLLLAANDTVFHEPIAVSYFLFTCFIALLAQVILFDTRIDRILIPAACIAGLMVHARPHLAVALYLGTCLLILGHLHRHRLAGLVRAAMSGAILAGFGGALLALNYLRSGNALLLHGSFEPGPLQYGMTYWGLETTDTPRIAAFIAHGTFNPGRIPGNLLLYLFNVPGGLGEPLVALFRQITRSFGFIRIENSLGAAYLWAPWLILIVTALLFGRSGAHPQRRGAPAKRDAQRNLATAVLMIVVVIAALLSLSYGTVTQRYQAGLWPLVISVVLLLLPRLLARWGRGGAIPRAATLAFLAITGASALIGTAWSIRYAAEFEEADQFSTWSYDMCAEMVKAKGFPDADIARMCAL